MDVMLSPLTTSPIWVLVVSTCNAAASTLMCSVCEPRDRGISTSKAELTSRVRPVTVKSLNPDAEAWTS